MLDNIYETIVKDELYQSLIDGGATTAADRKPQAPLAAAAAGAVVVNASSIASQIKQLSHGLDRVTAELQSQVRQQHGALLSQASHAGKLSVALDAVCGHMERLQSGADRLRAHIHAPFAVVETQTHVLERLHGASHLLRQSGRFLQLSRQLQVAAGKKDALAQACVLHELEPLVADEALAAVDLIRDERAAVLTARQRINAKTNNDLLQGLRAGNEALVSRSLQIIGSLHGRLDVCVANLLETFQNDIQQALQECFAGTAATVASGGNGQNATRKSSASRGTGRNGSGSAGTEAKRGPGKAPLLVTSQHFRTKLWHAIGWLFDEEIHSYCAQIVLLQQCLQAYGGTEGGGCGAGVGDGTDAITGTPAADVEQRFWLRLELLLRRSFGECAIHVRQCLQQDLPKLLAAARGLQSRFGTKFAFGETVFQALEAGYLEQCAVNLKAPLVGVDSPTERHVDDLVRAAATELSAAMVDGRLCLLVASVFNACGGEFVSRIRAQVKLGTDSKQVIDIPNAAQQQNIHLANALHYYDAQVRRAVQNLGAQFAGSAAAEILLKDLNASRQLIATIAQQLFESMQKAISIILLSMHREPGLTSTKAPANSNHPHQLPPSLYMKELQEFVHRTWNLHITPFHDRQTIADCGKALAECCIELFIHNVIIIRPITPVGRQKLHADTLHLETALRPMVEDISSFGRPYRQLRAVASLLMMTSDELAAQPVQLDGPLAPFAVLLLQFGHAGAELISPHTAAGWSNEKLLDWLAGHTADRERMELINGALQKYRTTVRQRNIVQYDPVYPGIVAYFERVTKAMAAVTATK